MWNDGTVLYHYGVKGQKWGVRKYQNEDGSLTEEGRKRYLKGSADRTYKELKRAIRNKRAEIYGGSNRWAHTDEIGEHGKAIRADSDARRKEYANSKEFKSWESNFEKTMNKAFADVQNGKMSVEQYDELQSKLWKQRPRKNFDDVAEWSYTVGKGYANNYVEKGGKTLTIARLRDLGFDEKSAKAITERLLLKKLTLATV